LNTWVVFEGAVDADNQNHEPLITLTEILADGEM
jgi:hypothetical protein